MEIIDMEQEAIEKLRKVTNLKIKLFEIRRIVITVVSFMLVSILGILAYTGDSSNADMSHETMEIFSNIVACLSVSPFFYLFYIIAESMIPKKPEKEIKGMFTRNEVLSILEEENETFNEYEKIFISNIFGIQPQP